MATPYHTIVNDVEAPLQKGMSPQTMARFKAKPILLDAGQPRPEQRVARGEGAADAAARRHRVRAADRLREHREPAAGARRRRAPARWRSGCRSARAADSWSRQLLGESCLLAVFGGLGGLLVAQWTLNLMAALLPAQAADTVALTHRSDRDAVRRGAGDRHRPAVRAVPGAAQHAAGSDLVARRDRAVSRPARGRRRASARRWRRRRSRCRWRCWCRRACSRAACSTSAASISA